jgi:predicted NUDIX family phosphoesterase
MSEMILTVREDDLRSIIGVRPFIALPREEIDRHYASVELHPMACRDAKKDASILPLVAIIAVHYNYSWLTFTSKNSDIKSTDTNDTLSLGLTGHIIFDGHNDIFLDERIKSAAMQIVNENITTQSGYDLRLAGLLRDAPAPSGKRGLGIVFIARLHQQGVIVRHNNVDIHFLGTGELQQNRQQFDNWSRVIIDHITAL